MKKVLLVISLLFLGLGLAILLYDLDTFLQYGVHINEVAAITDEGYIIAWPTGETPWFAQISVRSWVVFFLLSALGAYCLRVEASKDYRGRICRGTE
jgi:hypothetical protein